MHRPDTERFLCESLFLLLSLLQIKNRKLKFGVAIFTLVAVGGALPVIAAEWQVCVATQRAAFMVCTITPCLLAVDDVMPSIHNPNRSMHSSLLSLF